MRCKLFRSYQYTENSYLNYSMQNNLFQQKEIALARQFVEKNHIKKDLQKNCPLCGCKTSRFFFNKWNVDYLCCDECDSIYAVCDENVVEAYLSHKDLLDFRLSSDYQNQITESRRSVWADYLEWVEVRAYRFLGRNKRLTIFDVGNRFCGLSDLTRESELCGRYIAVDSAFMHGHNDMIKSEEADLVFYNDVIKSEINPSERIRSIRGYLKEDGLLFLGARAGSGFDIITLKENNTKIYPYEHVLLPSVKGITALLNNNGFEVLEITTPGVMDVKYVMDDLDKLGDREEFVRYLLKEKNETILQEFQRFLQKSCMSSFIRVIARKAMV